MLAVRRAYLLTFLIDRIGRALGGPGFRTAYKGICAEMWGKGQHVYDELPARTRYNERTGRPCRLFTFDAGLGPHVVLIAFAEEHMLPELLRFVQRSDPELRRIIERGPLVGGVRDADRAGKARAHLVAALLRRSRGLLKWDGTDADAKRWSRLARRLGIRLPAESREAMWLVHVHRAARILELSSMNAVTDFAREYRKRLRAAELVVSRTDAGSMLPVVAATSAPSGRSRNARKRSSSKEPRHSKEGRKR